MISLQLIRKIVEHLRAERAHRLAELNFAVIENESAQGKAKRMVVVQREDGVWEDCGGQQILTIRVPLRVFSEELAAAAERDRVKSRKVGSIEKRRGVLGSAPVLAGTRVPTAAIWRLHQAGYTTDRILKNYPGLQAGDIAAALKEERRRRQQPA